jgi:acyl-CoA thioester hydrolase
LREILTAETGVLREGAHLLPQRVYYEDTDFSGFVYHASYLRFLERGRTEMLRALGVHQREIHAGDAPFVFVVRAMRIEFLKPARMDDVVIVETRAAQIGGASMILAQKLMRAGETLVEAEVRVAVVAAGRPVRLPPDIRARLSQA